MFFAEWPSNLFGAKLSDAGQLYIGRQGGAENIKHSRTLE